MLELYITAGAACTAAAVRGGSTAADAVDLDATVAPATQVDHNIPSSALGYDMNVMMSINIT
jgi:hypothetical protein